MVASGNEFVHSTDRLATRAQKATLTELGLAVTPRLTSYEANRLIRAHLDEWARLPATPAQRKFLQRRGCWRPGMGRGHASELIDRFKSD